MQFAHRTVRPQIHQSRLDSWPQHYPWIKEEGFLFPQPPQPSQPRR